jgi:hypothetical protein
MGLEFYGRIFEKHWNIKFDKDLYSGSRIVPRGQTWRSLSQFSLFFRTPLKLRVVLQLLLLAVADDRSWTRWWFGLHLWICPIIANNSEAFTVSLMWKVCRCTHKSLPVATLRAPNWRTMSAPEINPFLCDKSPCADFCTVGLDALKRFRVNGILPREDVCSECAQSLPEASAIPGSSDVLTFDGSW